MSASYLTRAEFISQLESKLMVLPDNERQNAIDYYDNFIKNTEDEGATIASLGTPGEIAADILASYVKRESQPAPVANSSFHGGGVSHAPVTEDTFATAKKSNSRNWWLIAIIAIFAIPLVAGVGGGLIGIFAAIWSIVFAFAVSGITFIATGIASAFLSIFIFFQDTGFGLLAAGMGLILIGCGIFFMKLTVSIAKWIIALVKNIFRRLQNGRFKTV